MALWAAVDGFSASIKEHDDDGGGGDDCDDDGDGDDDDDNDVEDDGEHTPNTNIRQRTTRE